MKNDPLEDKAIEAYKSFLAKEISRPEVEQDKRLFMARHFTPKPVWVRSVPFLVPALAVFCLFFFFHMGILSVPQLKTSPKTALQVIVKKSSPDAPLVTAEAPSRIEVTTPKKLKKIKIKVPPILVMRATSQVGQPMISQRKVNEKPVTVVWVFTGSRMNS